ncbi:MAG: ABC transporter ATP-binding protein [Hydrogenibacillus sp.]|nr:ABC transporter ATP-binding protein [Hydrogenibacillus sp.]
MVDALEDAPAMEDVLVVEGLTKRAGGRTLIADVSFRIGAGEVFALLGPNGAGKTTTMRAILGLVRPTAGEVAIAGRLLRRERKAALAAVGSLIETPAVYPFMSGWDNLWHVARMRGVFDAEALRALVAQVGLSPRIRDPVRTYSLGMRQRLAIAMALVGRPKLLVLDEPMNGLDPPGMLELRRFIRRLAQEEGLGVLLSSHLLGEVEAVADRIGLMLGGRLLWTAKAADVRKAAVRRFRLRLRPAARAEQVLKALPFVARFERRHEGAAAPAAEIGDYLVWFAEAAEEESPDAEKQAGRRAERLAERQEERQAAALVAALVSVGVEVYTAAPDVPPLEELFRSWTAASRKPS